MIEIGGGNKKREGKGTGDGGAQASLPGSVSHAHPRAATVCTQCALGLRLAPLQLTLHCSPSQKPRSLGGRGSGSSSSVSPSHCCLLRPRCAHGSRGAGNPGARGLPAVPQPGPTRSDDRTPAALQRTLICAPQRSQSGRDTLSLRAITLYRPSQDFVWGSSAGRRHLLEFLTGAGSTAVRQGYLAYSALHYDPRPARVTSARRNHEALGSCLAFGWTQPRCAPVRQR